LGYSGAVPSEDSSGAKRESITKTGQRTSQRIVLKLPGVSVSASHRAPTAQATEDVGTHQGGRLERQVRAHETLCPAAAGARTEEIITAWDANCWLIGAIGVKAETAVTAADGGLTKCKNKNKGKSKNFPKNEKTKTDSEQ